MKGYDIENENIYPDLFSTEKRILSANPPKLRGYKFTHSINISNFELFVKFIFSHRN